MKNNFLSLEFFNKLPVEKKLTLAILTTAIAILLVVSLAYISKSWFSGLRNLENQLITHVQIIEPKAIIALINEDKNMAVDTLKFLHAHHSIIDAHIVDHNHALVAEYVSGHHSPIKTNFTDPEGFSFKEGQLTYEKHLYQGTTLIGAIHLTSDYSEINNALIWQIFFTILIVLVSLFISSTLAKKAKKAIFSPLKELQDVADYISKKNDYSLRAKKTSDDEIGVLVDKFNEMLTVIENNHSVIEEQTRNLLVAQSLAKVGNWEWVVATNEVELSAQALELLDIPPHIKNPPIDFLINRLEDKYAVRFKEAIGILLTREQSYTTVEYKVKPIHDSVKTLVVELNVQYDNDGGINKIIGVIQDVTNKKKTSDDLLVAQKLDSVGLVAGGIAHDFNNLLTMIMGHLTLGKMSAQEIEDNELYMTLDKAEKAAYRAKALTHQLLTFSKNTQPEKAPLDLKALLLEVADRVFGGTSIIHTSNFKQDTLNVNADIEQIKQVINDLYINALQSMKNDGLITTTSENIVIEQFNDYGLNPGHYIMVKIRDEGCGISKSDIKRIFDPYYTTKNTGPGLGLSTCYTIMKNHGGTIEVNSELNKGTEIALYIPYIDDDNLESEINSISIDKGSGRILLMEDDKSIGEFIFKLLTKFGFKVDHTLKGEDTLDYYKKSMIDDKPYEVVILDLTIKGGMGGRETIEELLRIDPKVKAIVSSGYSKDPIMENYSKFGFKAAIKKPYKSTELIKIISNTITNADIEIT